MLISDANYFRRPEYTERDPRGTRPPPPLDDYPDGPPAPPGGRHRPRPLPGRGSGHDRAARAALAERARRPGAHQAPDRDPDPPPPRGGRTGRAGQGPRGRSRLDPQRLRRRPNAPEAATGPQ